MWIHQTLIDRSPDADILHDQPRSEKSRESVNAHIILGEIDGVDGTSMTTGVMLTNHQQCLEGIDIQDFYSTV